MDKKLYEMEPLSIVVERHVYNGMPIWYAWSPDLPETATFQGLVGAHSREEVVSWVEQELRNQYHHFHPIVVREPLTDRDD